MARGLFILNDASYGTERSYNGIRFADAVSKRWRVSRTTRDPDAAMFRQVSAS
jgi:hypothetical protein